GGSGNPAEEHGGRLSRQQIRAVSNHPIEVVAALEMVGRPPMTSVTSSATHCTCSSRLVVIQPAVQSAGAIALAKTSEGSLRARSERFNSARGWPLSFSQRDISDSKSELIWASASLSAAVGALSASCIRPNRICKEPPMLPSVGGPSWVKNSNREVASGPESS